MLTLTSRLEVQHVTLPEFLVSKGFAMSTSDRKVRCPFHGDYRPSAVVNIHNGRASVYCFTCGRLYRERDFHDHFGRIVFDPLPSDSPLTDSLMSGSRFLLPEEVLFSYRFT